MFYSGSCWKQRWTAVQPPSRCRPSAKRSAICPGVWVWAKYTFQNISEWIFFYIFFLLKLEYLEKEPETDMNKNIYIPLSRRKRRQDQIQRSWPDRKSSCYRSWRLLRAPTEPSDIFWENSIVERYCSAQIQRILLDKTVIKLFYTTLFYNRWNHKDS